LNISQLNFIPFREFGSNGFWKTWSHHWKCASLQL